MTDIVPIPALRPSSEFPTNADRNAGVFNPKAFNWANSSRDMAADMSAIADAARTNAIATHEIAVDAKNVTESNKTAAQNAQNAAELAAINAAGSAAFYGRWSELTGALDMPANVTHDDKDWRLVRNLPDVTAAEPGVSDAWEEVKAGLIRQTRTANVALDASASGQLIEIVSGTFTQTFAATATLGDGWWCYLKNSGSGDITLDPNASELIDGLTSYIMYPGEVRLVQCDGTALRSVVLNSFYKVFTASGAFIKPPGYSAFQGMLWGGGGGGGLGAASYRGGGGGGGACNAFTLPSVLFSTAESIAIGSGGWSAGGTSSIGTALVQAFGGGAGGAGSSSHSGGGGGGGINGSGGNGISGSNGNGGDPAVIVSGFGIHNGFGGGNNSGGATVYGGGGGGSGTSTQNGQSAIYGGGGGAASGASTGGASKYGGAGGGPHTAGTAPGGGGGGGNYLTAPGEGASGELRIWGVI